MPKLRYTPKALEDLQGIKAYIVKHFGIDRAKKIMSEIALTARQLEKFPEKQDFLQILFGINSVSEEGEDYWSSQETEW